MRAVLLIAGLTVAFCCAGTAVAETNFNAPRDIAENNVKYFIVGQPHAHDDFFTSILKDKYNITVMRLGCTPGSQEAEAASTYNDEVVSVLGKKFGPDFIVEAENEAKTRLKESKKP